MQHCAIRLPWRCRVQRLRIKKCKQFVFKCTAICCTWCEGVREEIVGSRYAALPGDDFNWQIKMCTPRKIDAYECQIRAFQIEIYCAKSTELQNECYRIANRLQSSSHTHAHNPKEQETSIIQNIRNCKRLSTIAPSSANHAQFVKIISSLVVIFFFPSLRVSFSLSLS